MSVLLYWFLAWSVSVGGEVPPRDGAGVSVRWANNHSSLTEKEQREALGILLLFKMRIDPLEHPQVFPRFGKAPSSTLDEHTGVFFPDCSMLVNYYRYTVIKK